MGYIRKNTQAYHDIVYPHLHGDEVTSYKAARAIVKEYGGGLFYINQNNKRTVTFKCEGKKYTFDPNRMFTKNGVKNTLKMYGPTSKKAEQELSNFANWVLGRILNKQIVAVHNNRNKEYNISSYLDKNK